MFLNLRPKCANLSCAASFDWLGGGRLFRFPRKQRELASTGNNFCENGYTQSDISGSASGARTSTHFTTRLIAES